jgi:hypothetical protein
VYALVGAGVVGALGDRSTRDENGTQPDDGDSDTLTATQTATRAPDTARTTARTPPSSDARQLLSVADTIARTPPLFGTTRERTTGRSSTTTDSITLSGGLTACVYGYDGDGPFVVESDPVDVSATDEEGVLVDQVGAGGGTTALPTASGEWRFEVDASGAWQLAIGQPLPPAEFVRTVPASARGDHPSVVGPVEITAPPVLSATHEGEGEFLVRALPGAATADSETTVAVEAVGSYDGETSLDLSPAVYWLDVTADAAWELSLRPSTADTDQ